MIEIIRCTNCPNQMRMETPREGQKLKCTACHFEFKWSRAMVSVVRRDSEPARRENVPTVRRVSSPARSGNENPVFRAVSAIRRVVQPVTRDVVTAGKSDSAKALLEWYEAPDGFGTAKPLVDMTPIVELGVLPVVCSGDGRKFTQTYIKQKLGSPLRLCDNHSADSYMRMAKLNGARISEGKPRMFYDGEIDRTGWQCICGWGRVQGTSRNSFWCGNCGWENCARSVLEGRGCVATAECGNCGFIGILEEKEFGLQGHQFVARRA
ncbi:hypothetical protein LMG28614_05639 [Paraburkholderia ultramafica]|uniref:Uncharacterized protein n=1 Tax=Paraburkholderia ultramafica TaxID=1544867 RepID=A0A6S7D097_9BURK|nr:hypothetical protein [Paraburkholderia ultramafica]CAB3802553.1 hypothetical protein LMG28614_05639 [Paraburkholderia ultramafica]